MAITQNAQTATRGNSVTSLTRTINGVTAGGSLVAAGTHSNTADTATASDNNSNTWNSVVRYSNTRVAAIWLAANVNSGNTTITWDGWTGTSDAGLCCFEYDQILEVDDTGTNESTSATAHSCGSVTSTVNDAVFITSSRCFTNPGASTAETNYTIYDAGGGAGSQRERWQDYIATSTSTETGTWDSTNTVTSTSCHAVLNEQAAGGEVFFENRHPIEQGMKPQTAAGMGGVLIE